MRDGVPLVMKQVGFSDLRNAKGPSNFIQDTHSKLVGGGRSNRVRKGDGEGSKLETICTREAPPSIRCGVQSNFNIQAPRDVSFFCVSSFLSFCLRITPCAGNRGWIAVARWMQIS